MDEADETISIYTKSSICKINPDHLPPMPRDSSGPAAVFGIRIKSIIIVIVFSAVLLVAVNWSEITSHFNDDNVIRQAMEQAEQNTEKQHIIVDEEMLSNAIREVQNEKLAELETSNGSIPTDRFFYVVELISGGDLDGVDLTIEPDQVVLLSEGGTRTTIKRTDVQKVHRYKLPPTPKEQ